MGYVYLRHDPGNKAYKIGYTISSSQRASAYRTENPHMTLVYEYESCRHTCAELALRDRLKRLKQPYGKDWFKEDKFVVWIFEQVRAEFSDEPELVAKRATATAEERRRALARIEAQKAKAIADRIAEQKQQAEDAKLAALWQQERDQSIEDARKREHRRVRAFEQARIQLRSRNRWRVINPLWFLVSVLTSSIFWMPVHFFGTLIVAAVVKAKGDDFGHIWMVACLLVGIVFHFEQCLSEPDDKEIHEFVGDRY